MADKLRLILFGIYPLSEQCRPALVVIIVIPMVLVSMPPRFWTRALLAAWGVAVTAMLGLMWGGFFGMSYVPTQSWGGLPVTLILSVLSLGLGFPITVFLALGRRSSAPVARVCFPF